MRSLSAARRRLEDGEARPRADHVAHRHEAGQLVREQVSQEARDQAGEVAGRRLEHAPPQQAYGGYAAAPAAGPALTGNTNLPPGWQELTSDGQVYYWNTETNVTQYERPA